MKTAALILAVLLSHSAFAEENFALSDLTISPPMANMSGGDYAMESLSVGPNPSIAAGGDFALEAILTPLPPIIVFGDAEIFITLNGPQATITWTTPSPGYVLESSRSLGPAAQWDPVTPTPAEGIFSIDAATDTPLFFRLRRP